MATLFCAIMEHLDDFARFLLPGRHMRIPKSRVQDPCSDGWKEVLLYLPMKGSVRSYRKGCLHIHDIAEDECWDLHLDKVDPEQDPIRHLINDAPALVISAACFVISALLMAKFRHRGPL